MPPYESATNNTRSISSPLGKIRAVVPGNSLLPDGECRAILATTAGTVNITDSTGTDVDAVPVNAGVNPIRAQKIRAGGSATGLFAGY